VFDELFRAVGPGKRSAGITLTSGEVFAFNGLVASRKSLPTYPPNIFDAGAPAESPLDIAQRQIAELQAESDHLRSDAREVALEHAPLRAECAVLEGVLRDLEWREARLDGLEAENARLRAERVEIESLRAAAANAEAELARQTENLHGFAAVEGERLRLKGELDALRPVVELLMAEAKRHRAHEPWPDCDAPINLLAELNLLVKDAGAYQGSVVLETLARSRADELERTLSTERSERAVAEAELERLRAIETKWQAVEPELPRRRQAQADAAAWQGPLSPWSSTSSGRRMSRRGCG
jgi:DNA repair exonuclease SbcCD ATPase subunit